MDTWQNTHPTILSLFLTRPLKIKNLGRGRKNAFLSFATVTVANLYILWEIYLGCIFEVTQKEKQADTLIGFGLQKKAIHQVCELCLLYWSCSSQLHVRGFVSLLHGHKILRVRGFVNSTHRACGQTTVNCAFICHLWIFEI